MGLGAFLDRNSDYIIVLGSIVVICFILFFISKTKPTFIQEQITSASKQTQFASTYFEIYDKTNKYGICNRLIIVKPFEWQFWAKDGKIYVLVDTNFQCPQNYTPATLVPNSTESTNSIYDFKSICIHSLLEDIISSYTNTISPVKVSFDIQKLQEVPDKFTIIDALHYLLNGYLTMDIPNKSSNIHSTSTVIDHKFINNTLTKGNDVDKQVEEVKMIPVSKCYEKLINSETICTLTNDNRRDLANVMTKRSQNLKNPIIGS